MYSDTHFHFQHCTENLGTKQGAEILSQMAQNQCFFGLDIGTKADDLLSRQSCVDSTIAQIQNTQIANKVRDFIYFSAGIWPSTEEIENRTERMKVLKSQINEAFCSKDNDTLHRKIIAIGECGLDHHWNPSGPDGRCKTDFDSQMLENEKELFSMQLSYAKELQLPVIVHSRDAFEDTYNCIKESGYNNGIIHCFSYGLEEAKAFLEKGWYISLSGSVTYTKKSKMEQMIALIKNIPQERLLIETDSPYLAPVPMRGSQNNPLNIKHTYKFVAQILEITENELCTKVDKNIKELFNLAK